ncbi:nuclear cap-binding protein subunit 1 [Kwoniella mangroviensis CBS 10435]|uniref:Nuclear cap-binding protein subunit 1 n=1 Tax=Kwoniella mangroviensis CBS 10435 TaxID=1331196 RepID=A0A1B9II90_9TREE|nr:nuclear cap-binding protein subunit 1 [Kwoniella mangroviensis CBS 10435]
MSYQNGFNPAQMMGFGNPYAAAFGSPGGYGGYGSPGRGGGRGRGRDDRRGGRGGGRGGGGSRDSRPPIPENSNARMRKMVLKLGDDDEYHPVDDPHRLSRVLKRAWREGSAGVCEGFRISVTQQPHKHSYLVVLLLSLSRRNSPTTEINEGDEAQVGDKRKAHDINDEDVEYGREVLEDLSRALRGWVEGREWQNVRLGLQFFSLLVPAGLVTSSSLLGVYRSLLAVLEEVGGGGDRAERAVRAVGEGLIRSGKVLYENHPEEVENLVSAIEGYIIGRRNEVKSLVDPFSPVSLDGQEHTPTPDTLDNFLSALHALRADSFAPPHSLPRYWESATLSEGTIQSDPYELSPISMPPEMYAVDSNELDKGEGRIGNIKLFGDDVVPPPETLEGWLLRSLVLDIINIYEVNRKECATLLLSLRKFLPPNTFKPVNPPTEEDEDKVLSTWSSESLTISTLLNSLLTLPRSTYKSIYYGSVITELCKISPNTVAPPVGRAVRKIFSYLGAGGSEGTLDIECQNRVAVWFSTHLSNFGFQWMWKEWIPDLDLPLSHPKRAFMRRVTELEVRLAYYDRILDTLPEPMKAEGAGVISSEPPEPFWPYEKPDHPLHTEAKELLQLFRSKTSPSDIRTHIENLPNSSSGNGESISEDIRKMVFETLLHLGSRSFSHFLNATERYLDLLRYLTSESSSRKLLLESVWTYWKYSHQMKLISIDKYLQYGILEGLDIVEYLFESADSDEVEEGDGWTDGWKFEILKMTIEKHVGRTQSIKNRLKMIEREDEMARARRAAELLEKGGDVGEGTGEEDMEEDTRAEGSKAFNDAQTSLDIQSTRLEKILIATIKQFVSSLLPTNSASSNQGLKGVLTLLKSGEEGLWSVRARLGWYKEFVRMWSAHLIPLAEPIENSVFSLLSSPDENDEIDRRAVGLVKGIWNSALEL